MIKDKFLLKLIPILFLAVLGFASIYLLYKERTFLKEELSLEIFSQDAITAGEEVKYSIRYQNNSEINLKNLELIFEYPPGSMVYDSEQETFRELSSDSSELGDLLMGEKGEREFKAIIFGYEGEEKKAQATLKYSPEKSNARFESKEEFLTTVINLPLALNFNFPTKISIGKEVEFSLNYISTSKSIFPDLQIHLEYPQDFEFKEANPSPKGGSQNIWEIGDVAPSFSGEIRIRGVLKGDPQEKKVFIARLGKFDDIRQSFNLYKEAQKEVSLSLPPFYISQIIKDLSKNVVEPGQKLEWEIYYRNESSDEIIEDLEIQMALEGEAFDFNSLKLEQGQFYPSAKFIIWKGLDTSQLLFVEPGEEGMLNFSIKVKKDVPQDDFNDKNFILKSRVSAKISGASLKEERKELKLLTSLTFSQQGLFNGSPIENSGPIPPKVEKTTTYTILWQVLNTTNDVSSLEIRGAIPQGVNWQGRIYPQDQNLAFDSNSGEIIWHIGDLSAATGILMPARTVAFQVSITPQEKDIGKILELIGPSYASGIDSFTGDALEKSSGMIDTTLPDDPTVSYNQGIVIP